MTKAMFSLNAAQLTKLTGVQFTTSLSLLTFVFVQNGRFVQTKQCGIKNLFSDIFTTSLWALGQ
ncbi:hypothetical protein DRO33_03920 [Candidatus Bathyarchaeota archaeon]|nr:MAG: hypothetical protein DRO33_03920 [Candidatus Bathyarchaeota archaeon]